MKNFILYIGILIYIFLSTSVAAKIGIGMVGTFSSLIIVLLFIHKIIEQDFDQLFRRFKTEFLIIAIGLFIMLLKYALGDIQAIKQVLFFILVPMILSILIKTKDGFTKNKLRNIVLFFFVSECLLAIFERTSGINVFPYVQELSDSISTPAWDFRSTAFLGHPLGNALVVSTIMGFVLTTSMNIRNKLFFVLLGFVALLCFNARGASLAWFVLAFIYLIYILVNSRRLKISPFFIIGFSIIGACFLGYLMIEYGFGGRLLHSDILDGSAQTRLDVFQAFSFINSSDFWLGNSSNYLNVTEKLGAAGVENSYVVIILNYGIVMFLLLFVAYFFWMNRLLNTYTLFHKFLIIASFIVVGSMNNALAGDMPWGFFIICVHSFPFLGKSEVKQIIITQNLINTKTPIIR